MYRPQFQVSSDLLASIERISALRERILEATVHVPWIPALQKDTRIRNTHSSTAIEGNPLTLEQVRALEEGRPLSAGTARAEREILNYFAGLRYIQKYQQKKLITHEDLFKLHAIIAAGVMDQGESGRYRDIAVRVGRHLPPPPGQVSGLMSELLEWWNEESKQWSPIVTSSIIHYRFEDIHPFADGNGRTGRILALWELYRRGFDTHHIFSVDEFYWEDRPRYYEMLDFVKRQGGDLTSWLEYTTEGLFQILEKVWLRIERLQIKIRPEKIVLSLKQEKLLQILRDHEGLSPREIWQYLKLSKQGTMNIMNPLIKAGLVRRIGTRKSGRYILG
jgi:Fic family protein